MLKYLMQLRDNGVTGEIVKEVVDYYQPILNERKKRYDRYKAATEGVPIFTREYEHEPLTDAKINNDFFSEIVDLKTGYFSGVAASYAYDKESPDYKKASEVLTRLQVRSNLASLDSRTTRDCAICGVAYRLMYVNPEGEQQVTMLDPTETFVLYERDSTISEFGFRVYVDAEDNVAIDVHDKALIYHFTEIDGVYTEDADNRRLHMASLCPVVQYENNDELQGDAEKVLALIDAYDRTVSDLNAEIEALRLAYFAVFGSELSEETARQMRDVGAFGLPGGTDAKFITKSWDSTVIEKHLDRIEQNIYQFSKTPNMRDERFGNNSSGVALKYKLSGIESKASVFERKKIVSDIRMFQVLASSWALRKIHFDPWHVIIEHHRNIPMDLNEIADAVLKFRGIVSDQTLLSLIPFIDDPAYEQELIEKQKDGIPSLFKDDDDSGDEDGSRKVQQETGAVGG